jgi:hypothetical protein
MKKPIMHNCTKCGNKYYYRKVKSGIRECPICKGSLLPEGYEFGGMPGESVRLRPSIPMPNIKPAKFDI